MSHSNEHIQNDSAALAEQAAAGDATSRQRINDIAHPIISYQADRFCKRFCHNNKYYYRCTLQKPWGSAPADALLCEWGNATYGWMLDDLTSAKRLRKFRGENGVRINDYLFTIANSLPFYERWKEWRFGKRLHVPTYIQELHEHASSVFIGLYKKLSVADIAQINQFAEQTVAQLANQIIITLTQRHKLHLLDAPQSISLSGYNNDATSGQIEDAGSDTDIPYEDTAAEDWDTALKLNDAWQQLNTTEQFVIEAMIIEEQEASDVLNALQTLDIAISDGVPAAQTNRQQLYYFRRKTLAKLATLMGIDKGDND